MDPVLLLEETWTKLTLFILDSFISSKLLVLEVREEECIVDHVIKVHRFFFSAPRDYQDAESPRYDHEVTEYDIVDPELQTWEEEDLVIHLSQPKGDRLLAQLKGSVDFENDARYDSLHVYNE